MKLKKVALTVSAVMSLSLLNGCNQDTAKSAVSVKEAVVSPKVESAGKLPEPAVQVDLSSPDRAIKTLFAMQDRASVVEHNRQVEEQANAEKNRKTLESTLVLFDGLAKRYLEAEVTPAKPILETVAREILKVETETETRAIVLVSATNTTPLPPGEVLDEYDKKWRTEGFKYRYIMTKAADGWKIEDLQEWGYSIKKSREEWIRPHRIDAVLNQNNRVRSIVNPLF